MHTDRVRAPRALRRAIVAWCCLAFVSGCETPTLASFAPGYSPTSLVPFIYHWSAGHEIALFVDRTNEPDDANLDVAVRAGIDAWVPVGRFGEIKFRIVTNAHDADVIIHHSTAPRLITSDCNIPLIPAGGFTFFCVDANSKAEILPFADGTPSHVKMDVLVSRATAGDNAHFRAFVAHELGHVLGIGAHSGNIADLMFGAPSRLTPSTADVETLLYVLGQTPTVRF